MKELGTLAGWLLVLGGISLGLDGLMRWELLDSVLGDGSMLDRLVDIAIGASALYMAMNMLGMKRVKNNLRLGIIY
jgi:uncharacterized membrane protein YuzA (DUF378 family)